MSAAPGASGSTPGGSPPGPAGDRLLDGVSVIFESLGRALLCLDRELKIVHASRGLDRLIGPGAVEAAIGREISELLGDELFGPDGSLRRALMEGERREGWGAAFRLADRPSRRISLTAAPVVHPPGSWCDPRIAHVVVLRSGEDGPDSGSSDPTLFAGMIARSAAMLQIFHLVEQLAESDATVLIGGESGTGKEMVARAIHLHSPRRRAAFVAVNCGALPGELLESELFGHVRGAFTGAVRDRQGRFEVAEKGTLFLDEVGDLPLPLQVKLLRVLQEKTFERVGESRPRTADVRIIAATNRRLREAVGAGEFRDDLYYRLRVVPIEVPPLRSRREDIEPLAHHLLDRVCRRHGRSVRLGPDAMRALLGYGWPGNVRELENALEYAVAVGRGQTLHAEDLPGEIQGQAPPAAREPEAHTTYAAPPPAPEEAAAGERERILAALGAHQWRRAETAAALGMSRTTLWRKMRELKIGG